MTPPQDRNRDHLHQRFRTPFERWLADARRWCQARGLDICVYETFRTAQRQAWLYASGRTRPGPVITYTLDSSHEYGVAADWVPLRLVNGQWMQDWSHATYDAIYAAVPPAKYGLEIFTWEKPHIQLAGINGPRQRTDGAVWAAANGIRANVIVGSIWPLEEAAPLIPPTPTRVFLRNTAGKNVLWDGKPAIYAGTPISAAWASQMLLVYPAGTTTTLGGLRLQVYPDGALQLDRAA